jgi:hypothetical protein
MAVVSAELDEETKRKAEVVLKPTASARLPLFR